MKKMMRLTMMMFWLLLWGSGGAVWAQQQKPAAEPSVDEILERYIKALGGKAAIEKITTRVSRGTVEIPSEGASGTVELYEKAPNKRSLTIVVPNLFSTRQVFDGTNQWVQDAGETKVRQIKGADLESYKRGADFYRGLRLRELYTKLTLKGSEKIQVRDGARETYVIEAAVSQGKPDKLYFDKETGLLLRTDSVEKTEDGNQDTREYTLDYKEVDGVKVPFTIRYVTAEGPLIIRLTEVKQNVELNDSVFSKPIE